MSDDEEQRYGRKTSALLAFEYFLLFIYFPHFVPRSGQFKYSVSTEQ